MPLLVLRGKAALVALRNSACALRDDAFTLIRSTKPDSYERINGTPGGHSPRSTGHSNNGLRGTGEMGQDHAQWVTWKIGIVGLIEHESMQRAVGGYIDAVIASGLNLINASVSARGTTHAPWATYFTDLNDAISELDQALTHVPIDTAPVSPRVLLSLVRRLIDQNDKIGQPHDDGSVDADGYPGSMEAEIRRQSWGREMEERETRHAFWLDRTTVETKLPRTTWSQRALASLFELNIAVQMLEKGPAADDVVAAYQVVLDQPYWNVESTEEWERRWGTKTAMPVQWPLMATERPMGRDALDRLDQAAQRYAASAARALQPRLEQKTLVVVPDPWCDPSRSVEDRVRAMMIEAGKQGRITRPTCREVADTIGAAASSVAETRAWVDWGRAGMTAKEVPPERERQKRASNRTEAERIRQNGGDND